MSAFLIQVSGHSIQEKADPRYVAGAKGPRFCDEPLKHGEYFNASPFWKREGYGRREAWNSISPGDEGLLYCTGSVDEHGACLSHLLTVDSVILSESDGARLRFSAVQELDPKILYSDIQDEIEKGSFSEQMNYCGQEGFNIAQIAASDIDRVRDLVNSMESQDISSDSYPDDSLKAIAEDHFGG
ncbi:hypothetical protein [Halorussus aquaticus]|uniref:RES domain-containing protein n=1 Tax=Halorussus aquaticus TaxID=2953748 RepID=A0ABD5Q5N9_9EURY|nr:hypothetical protein [Halorussus aquaticus]